MFYVGTNKVGFATAGVARIYIDGSNVGTGQSGAQLYYANGAIVNPVGMVTDFGGATIPSGWLLCYGQNVSRTGYPELFQIIGTGFGAGDGSTTFTMPDLRGTITAGKDDMGGVAASRITAAVSGITGTTLGATGGAQSVTLTRANLTNTDFLFDPIGSVLTVGTTTNAVQGVAPTVYGGIGAGGNSVTAVASTGTAATCTSTPGGHIYLNGNVAQTAVNKMPPTMIMNKIMFAGRP